MDYFTELEPHKVHETISINDMRGKILDMTKPLADIARTIDISIKNMNDQKNDVKHHQGTVAEIRKAIRITVIL